MQSMSVTSKQQSAEPPEEDYDNEDLSKLDVPDIPAVIGKISLPLLQASLNIGWRWFVCKSR